MKSDFKIGDVVETIDDNLIGIVKAINKDTVKILSKDGFKIDYHPTKLILYRCENITIQEEDIARVKKQKAFQTPKNQRSKPKKGLQKSIIDLHIHELIEDASGLTNHEILSIQLDKAKQKLEWAIQNKYKSVVFIHGVGQGVLRAELHHLFREYDKIEFYDASYQEYGLGATEVKIY